MGRVQACVTSATATHGTPTACHALCEHFTCVSWVALSTLWGDDSKATWLRPQTRKWLCQEAFWSSWLGLNGSFSFPCLHLFQGRSHQHRNQSISTIPGLCRDERQEQSLSVREPQWPGPWCKNYFQTIMSKQGWVFPASPRDTYMFINTCLSLKENGCHLTPICFLSKH